MVIRSTDRRSESAIAAGHDLRGLTYSPSQPPQRNSRGFLRFQGTPRRNTIRHRTLTLIGGE
jgi:hypothetical protein